MNPYLFEFVFRNP